MEISLPTSVTGVSLLQSRGIRVSYCFCGIGSGVVGVQPIPSKLGRKMLAKRAHSSPDESLTKVNDTANASIPILKVPAWIQYSAEFRYSKTCNPVDEAENFRCVAISRDARRATSIRQSSN